MGKMLKCKICGFVGIYLGSHIYRKHGISSDAYKIKFNVDKVNIKSKKTILKQHATMKKLFKEGKIISPFKIIADNPKLRKENGKKISKALSGIKQPIDVVKKRTTSIKKTYKEKGWKERTPIETQIKRNKLISKK